MLLRVINKIEKETANKILKVYKQIGRISKIVNFQYIRNELETNASENLKKFETSTKENEIVLFEEEMGRFEAPQHFIDSAYGDYEENEYCYNRGNKINSHEYLLIMKLNKEFCDFRKDNLINFSLQIWKKTSRKNYERQYELGGFGSKVDNIKSNEFFTFFSCQYKMYEEVSKILETKKEMISEYLGASIADDVINLFSGKKENDDIIKIAIDNRKLEKILYLNEENYVVRLGKNMFPLGIVRNNNYDGDASGQSYSQICLFLKKANNLVLDYYFYDNFFDKVNKLITDKNFDTIKENPKTLYFMEQNLNKWMNDLKDLADLESQIYDKIKTKFLVEKL